MTTDHGKQQLEFDRADPYAAALAESLRAFGYSTPAAIADLIDNSITAGARHIWLTFEWQGPSSWIALLDDGKGMAVEELVNAMRPGSRSPREKRDPTDLGRFGLGLKTASFSQCRSVTVTSKNDTDAELATRRWDLDYVVSTNEWRLLRTSTGKVLEPFQLIEDLDSGTAIVWETMDRVVGEEDRSNSAARDRFFQIAEQVEEHVAMVFHRFLQGRDRVEIRINGNLVEPWDPFMIAHQPQELPIEHHTMERADVFIRPFVLPHISKLPKEAHEKGSGPRGWNSQQGFYVYRNERLLYAGGWLNLGIRPEEHYKLARIAIDIPNSLDEAWEIDVRKSRARIPAGLREALQRIARATRARAAEVYRHRGKAVARSASRRDTFVWRQKLRHGKIHYEINREHPLIADLLSIDTSAGKTLKQILRLIEETVPVPQIYVDSVEKPDEHAAPYEGSPSRELATLADDLFRSLLSAGNSPTEARERLLSTEPFDRYPEVVESLHERMRFPND